MPFTIRLGSDQCASPIVWIFVGASWRSPVAGSSAVRWWVPARIWTVRYRRRAHDLADRPAGAVLNERALRECGEHYVGRLDAPGPAPKCRDTVSPPGLGRTLRVVGRTRAVPQRSGPSGAWPESRHRGGPISAGLCSAGAARGRLGPPGQDRRGGRCRRGCRRSAPLHPEPPGRRPSRSSRPVLPRTPARRGRRRSRRRDRRRRAFWRARCPPRPTRRCGRARPGGRRATPPAMAGG